MNARRQGWDSDASYSGSCHAGRGLGACMAMIACGFRREVACAATDSVERL